MKGSQSTSLQYPRGLRKGLTETSKADWNFAAEKPEKHCECLVRISYILSSDMDRTPFGCTSSILGKIGDGRTLDSALPHAVAHTPTSSMIILLTHRG